MRLLTFVALLLSAAAPALGWETRSDSVCRIEADTPAARVTIAYDPVRTLYAIFLTRSAPWPDASSFSIRFDGARPNVIATDRHFFPNGDSRTVSVVDRDFGNVLDGLAAGGVAHIGFDGEGTTMIPLTGAAPAVTAFRACADATIL